MLCRVTYAHKDKSEWDWELLNLAIRMTLQVNVCFCFVFCLYSFYSLLFWKQNISFHLICMVQMDRLHFTVPWSGT